MLGKTYFENAFFFFGGGGGLNQPSADSSESFLVLHRSVVDVDTW